MWLSLCRCLTDVAHIVCCCVWQNRRGSGFTRGRALFVLEEAVPAVDRDGETAVFSVGELPCHLSPAIGLKY